MLHVGKLLLIGSAFCQDINLGLIGQEELIPRHHDAEGLAPLVVSDAQLAKQYQVYSHDIPRYVERMKRAFQVESQGGKTKRGIHMPDWIIWGFPSIEQTPTDLVLYLGNQTLDKPVQIGTLDLVKSRLSAIDGVLLIRSFLDKYVDYDDLKITTYRAPLKKEEYSNAWTEIDDLILQMLISSAKYQVKQQDQDETVRLIGEFFRWRQIISDFCKASVGQVDDLTLPQKFEQFLKAKHNISPAEAKKYKYLLDLRRQHLGLILDNPADNPNLVSTIFRNFTAYGLTKDQEQADRYRDQIFPRE